LKRLFPSIVLADGFVRAWETHIPLYGPVGDDGEGMEEEGLQGYAFMNGPSAAALLRPIFSLDCYPGRSTRELSQQLLMTFNICYGKRYSASFYLTVFGRK